MALTSIAMKCLERIVRDIVVEQTKPFIDPQQFAYQAKRGVEDAVITMLHQVYRHLDKPRSYVRTLFIDFSSAFNTIQPLKIKNVHVEIVTEYTTFEPLLTVT